MSPQGTSQTNYQDVFPPASPPCIFWGDICGVEALKRSFLQEFEGSRVSPRFLLVPAYFPLKQALFSPWAQAINIPEFLEKCPHPREGVHSST